MELQALREFVNSLPPLKVMLGKPRVPREGYSQAEIDQKSQQAIREDRIVKEDGGQTSYDRQTPSRS